jgi:hypothetical protein
MPTLREKQIRFSQLVARLILRADELGFGVTLGEASRSPEEARRNAQQGDGISNSLHCIRLAIDLNLFRDGKFLVHTNDYLPLGEWWEAQGTDDFPTAWGGRFGDADHFSMGHQGVR